MKILKIIAGLVVASAITSCSMNDEPLQRNLANQIVGTYKGTLTSSITQVVVPATAEIIATSNYTIQVHCYGADIDTTLVLELYLDGNMMRVCFTGDDFKKEYGHSMSANYPMMGNMMGNDDNWNIWEQHMSYDHNSTDKHYGYFDMNAKMFNYTFDFKDMPIDYSRHFIGKR